MNEHLYNLDIKVKQLDKTSPSKNKNWIKLVL